MPIRIVNEDGIGLKTKVYDTETGEDLTAKLQISSIRIDDLEPRSPITARIEVWAPKVDITVAEATIKHVCPYCGHEKEDATNDQ